MPSDQEQQPPQQQPQQQQQQQQQQQKSTPDDNDNGNVEPTLSVSKSLTSIGFAATDRDIEDDRIITNIDYNIIKPNESNLLPPVSINTQELDEQQTLSANNIVCHCENHDIPKDILCIILICPQHQTIALQQIIDYYYFPSTPLNQPNQSLAETISSLFDIVIVKNNTNNEQNKRIIQVNLLQMQRIKIPKLRRYIKKWIFYSQIIDTPKNCICNLSNNDSSNNDEITWMPITKLPTIFTNVWGGEIIQFFNNDNNFWRQNFLEVNYEEIIEVELNKIKQELPANICPANLSIAAEYLFNEFYVQCHPSSLMSLPSFQLFCDKLEWFMGVWYKESRIKIFRHFDRQNKGYLDYCDLLNGLAILNFKTYENPLIDFPFFEEIFKKFNCRNMATTVRQKLVDNTIYFGRCETCLTNMVNAEFIKYEISSLLVYIAKTGEILKVFKLKPNYAQCESVMTFCDDIQNRNIFYLANEFISRIGKIQFCKNQSESNLESIENYYFENKSIMLHYLRMILEFAKRLFENESPILELHSPAYIFGYLNGSVEDLLMFSQNTFKTFPFIVPGSLLFMGNFLKDLENIDCLIYLLCMKILVPTKVFLIIGHNEIKFSQLPEDEDIIRNIIKQIYGLLPIACIIDEQLIVTNFSLPSISITKLKIIANWSRSMIPFNNIGKIYYKYDFIENTRHFLYYQQYRIFNRKYSTVYEDLIDELIAQSMMMNDNNNKDSNPNRLFDNIQQQQLTSQQQHPKMLKFIELNHLFLSIHSNSLAKEKDLNENEGFDFPTNNTYDLTTIISTRKLTNEPTCIFLDRNILRFICMD
ncbi:uncharacterized protein LOC113788585 [Dermatophagoides pteronyssinus]|uniref:uncharacterized protein LOC113788585 n=1 Tax=Dermatophagoides pteronyssinus TaxID=6956 RepID=UPI003F66C86C